MSRLFPKVELPDGEARNITPNGTVCEGGPGREHDSYFSNGFLPKGNLGIKSVGRETGAKGVVPVGNRSGEKMGGGGWGP
jgi:hypothetical protein